jgi:hypothetical protein
MESMVDHTDMSCSIWRRKPAELPVLFGEEHLQSYQTYLERDFPLQIGLIALEVFLSK